MPEFISTLAKAKVNAKVSRIINISINTETGKTEWIPLDNKKIIGYLSKGTHSDQVQVIGDNDFVLRRNNYVEGSSPILIMNIIASGQNDLTVLEKDFQDATACTKSVQLFFPNFVGGNNEMVLIESIGFFELLVSN